MVISTFVNGENNPKQNEKNRGGHIRRFLCGVSRQQASVNVSGSETSVSVTPAGAGGRGWAERTGSSPGADGSLAASPLWTRTPPSRGRARTHAHTHRAARPPATLSTSISPPLFSFP